MNQSDNAGTAETDGRREYGFQAEVNQVLDIVVNSLYSHREVFLRELVSNASDALDKLRFRATTEGELLRDEPELEIRIAVEKDQKVLSIADTGIGMTRGDGRKPRNDRTVRIEEVREALRAKGQGDGVELIGQFGVGFYSAFLVGQKVEVVSKSVDSDDAWRWISEAHGTYSIEKAPERKRRGTEVRITLKDDAEEFLDDWKIKKLVERYSDYVGHPIKLRRVEADENADFEWDTINKGSALWKRPKAEITDEQYEEFYKHLTHDWEKPLARTHFTIEGTQLYTGLVFCPRKAPFDLFDPSEKRGVRLYVKRVFIMDDCAALLPEWLRFVRGIVDSDDLPLNVSRETLQEDRLAKGMKKNIVKKILDMLDDLAEKNADDYATFWESFGVVLKEGLHYDPDSRDRLAKLVRYKSSKSPLTSLADYVKRMPENQKAIYYAIGPSARAVEGGPHMEALAKRGFEVLFMTDPVDEWALQGLEEFEGKKLVSAMKADLAIEEDEETKKRVEEKKEDFGKLMERIKTVLTSSVDEVRISTRLTESPCCLVVPEGGPHAHIERMLRQRHKDMPTTKRILEINPDHPVMTRLKRIEDERPASDDVIEWIKLLHDQALLAEGSPIEDPQAFARRIGQVMSKAMDATN